MQLANSLLLHDPYADFGDDPDGQPDGVASDICPRCGPVLLTTRDGRLEARRRDGMGFCRCTPAERLAAEADQDRRRRQCIDDRARRARKNTTQGNASPSATRSSSGRKQ
jgi:hypothetical protein